MSDESLAALLAEPAAAVAGLEEGLAEGLGVHPSDVEITRTVPDLLSSTRRLGDPRQLHPPRQDAEGLAADGRRLAATLVVDFDLKAEENSPVEEKVSALAAGDSSIAAAVSLAVEKNLEDNGIASVAVESMSAAVPTTTTEPSTTVEPNVAINSGALGLVALAGVFAVMALN